MPLSIATSALVGIRGAPVEVEVDVTTGIPAVRIVGLPDTAVGEARERIRSAIRASGFTGPLAGSPSTLPLPTCGRVEGHLTLQLHSESLRRAASCNSRVARSPQLASWHSTVAFATSQGHFRWHSHLQRERTCCSSYRLRR